MSRLKKYVRNYTQVGNDIINDKNLTLKAKGLFLFLLSKPDNWNFSARLIATQNKDSIASVNTGLRELEDFGLLNRIHVQGGYDYEIFDTIQIHLVENRLNGKSIEQKAKIHSMENRLNISNKELKANREERDNISVITPEVLSDYRPSLVDLDSIVCDPYFHIDEFLDECTKSFGIKSPVAYRAVILESLHDLKHKRHDRTMLAYQDFVTRFQRRLPENFNIFDVIGRKGLK